MDFFDQLKSNVLHLDPVNFIENNLTLDGENFRIHGNGYKPFADIYRYIAIKALEKSGKPVIIVKGRQVGATTMCAALEAYFMACGLFGTNGRNPMRLMHCFPQLDLAYAYTKDKLDPMISSAKPDPLGQMGKTGKPKTVLENLIDTSAPSNNSLQFKKFKNGNQIWIESIGLNGDRVRGRTIDGMLLDECFPGDQYVITEDGKMTIRKIYKHFKENKALPRVKTYNEAIDEFEYKNIINAWEKGERELIQIICNNRKIRCTPNHKFLTTKGWIQAKNLQQGSIIKTTEANVCQISKYLNDDQLQIVLGSFMGDGHIDNRGLNKHRLCEMHGLSQKEYCKWKADIFGSHLQYVEKNGFAQTPAYKFTGPTFCLEGHLPSKKKHCPQWVLDQLDERGLAVWFMDDGSICNGNAIFNTCDFDEDSQKRIIKKLKDFGINSRCGSYFKKDRNKWYYSIYLNKENYLKLCSLVAPYFHKDLLYKIEYYDKCKVPIYKWNDKFKNHGAITVKSISYLPKKQKVYDIEIEDNHNFIATSDRSKGGLIVHNCQDMRAKAMANATKTLTQAKYGKAGKGIQVYFGTPKQRSSTFHEMWKQSSQQYYHLHCEQCGEYFPLYTPGSSEWENIWLYGFIVKCVHCGKEQDKREAAERGKWISFSEEEDNKYIGFHINQLYIPILAKDDIIAEKPENNINNSETEYQNEVLGEFYSGDSTLITPEDIDRECADYGRKFRRGFSLSDNKRVYLGCDWGKRVDTGQNVVGERDKAKQGGQSYSCVVVLSVEGPERLSIEYAYKLTRNDPEYKMGVIEQIFRQYSISLAVGDIGYAGDLTHMLQTKYTNQFLASDAKPHIKNKIKFVDDEFPKVIRFEKNYYIAEMLDWIKRGRIRFPYGSYEQIAWLISHCCSMETKVTMSRTGDPIINYVKGSTPNDGFMALLNAYLAYKFDLTKGFTVSHPSHFYPERMTKMDEKIPMIAAYLPEMSTFGMD